LSTCEQQVADNFRNVAEADIDQCTVTKVHAKELAIHDVSTNEFVE
jgi:hypothetical protein